MQNQSTSISSKRFHERDNLQMEVNFLKAKILDLERQKTEIHAPPLAPNGDIIELNVSGCQNGFTVRKNLLCRV